MRALSSGWAQAQSQTAGGPVNELQSLYNYARQHVVGSDPRLPNDVVAELTRLMGESSRFRRKLYLALHVSPD